MAQCFRALVSFAEDLCLILNIHLVAQNHTSLQFLKIKCPLLLPYPLRTYMIYIHTCRKNIYIHNMFIILKKKRVGRIGMLEMKEERNKD